MPSGLLALAALSLLIWLYLALFHGRYWRADQRLALPSSELTSWPSVVAVVPARNEADVIGEAVVSLLTQDYRGALTVILVDDRSNDGTAEAARRSAAATDRAERLVIVGGDPLPGGWSGKLWAIHQGLRMMKEDSPDASFVWLVDADIVHAPTALRSLVTKAEAGRLDLVSLMVLLHCRSPIERLLIPAFVYFFQQLYPFPESNRS